MPKENLGDSSGQNVHSIDLCDSSVEPNVINFEYELQIITRTFKNLEHSQWHLTSPCNLDYNCLAWAVGDSDRFWGQAYPDEYWPAGAPRDPHFHIIGYSTLGVVISLFEFLGYTKCTSTEPEPHLEKIALYGISSTGNLLSDHSEFRHAARQLPSGLWASKLGPDWDIEHELKGLVGDIYGNIYQVMARHPKLALEDRHSE